MFSDGGIGKSAFLICVISLLTLSIKGQQAIEEIKALPLGSVVETTGTISSGDEWGQIRFLQDETAGIGLFGNSISSLQPGDSIVVRGVVSKYRGQLQLSPILSHTVISTGNVVTVHEVDDFTAQSLAANNSRFVAIACTGIHTDTARC